MKKSNFLKRPFFVGHFKLLIVALSSVFLFACSDDPEPKVETTYSVTDGFIPESQGIGISWSEYNSRTHKLTPKDFVFAVRDADATQHFFRIKSYYNDGSKSGYFSLKIAKGNETPKELVSDKNVKDERVCLSFKTLSFVDCSSATDVDLLFAAPMRPVAQANLKFPSGAIFTVPKQGRETYKIEAATWEEVDRTKDVRKEFTRLLDVYRDSKDGILKDGLRTNKVFASIVYDPTTDKVKVAGWTMGDDGTFSVLCEPVGGTHPLKTTTLKTFKVDPQEGKSYAIKLCDSTSNVEEVDPQFSLWPYAGVKSSVKGDLLLVKKSNGSEVLISLPSTLSWFYGKVKNVSNLEGIREIDPSKDGVVQYYN